MIQVEGYKAFCGTMQIMPTDSRFPACELTGDWLYRPDTDCWYGGGRSFQAAICCVAEDKT